MKKRIILLGSTGSIGKNVLKVVDKYPDKFRMCCLSTDTRWKLLKFQCQKYKPEFILINNNEVRSTFKKNYTGKGRILSFMELDKIFTKKKGCLVVNAIASVYGLLPTWTAINAGIPIALANKESLVIAGKLIMNIVKKRKLDLIPIDSEHSALFQVHQFIKRDFIEKIILTGSGGPFRLKRDLSCVTVKQALNHPRWEMGVKITIDSATLMNKGFEVIEAHHLFNRNFDSIDVVIHPESIIHGMVSLNDGTVIAHISRTDMIYPIQYALFYPEIVKTRLKKLNPSEMKSINFEKPDIRRFKLLKLAYQVGKKDSGYQAVLVGANDAAVRLFLKKEIKFNEIYRLVYRTINRFKPVRYTSVEELLQIVSWAEREVNLICKRL